MKLGGNESLAETKAAKLGHFHSDRNAQLDTNWNGRLIGLKQPPQAVVLCGGRDSASAG